MKKTLLLFCALTIAFIESVSGATLPNLTDLPVITDDDLFYVVDDPTGTPVDRKATAATLTTSLHDAIIDFSDSGSITNGLAADFSKIWVDNGASGNLAIRSNGDPNTGIYFPGADNVVIEGGGTPSALFANAYVQFVQNTEIAFSSGALGAIENAAFKHAGPGLINVTDGVLTTPSGTIQVLADPYDAGWNGDDSVASKNDIYDQIQSLGGVDHTSPIDFGDTGSITNALAIDSSEFYIGASNMVDVIEDAVAGGLGVDHTSPIDFADTGSITNGLAIDAAEFFIGVSNLVDVIEDAVAAASAGNWTAVGATNGSLEGIAYVHNIVATNEITANSLVLSTITVTNLILEGWVADRFMWADSNGSDAVLTNTPALSAVLLSSLSDAEGTGVAVFNTGPTIDGATLTGTIDAGGADDFEVPNGNNPTVDTPGQIAVDANDNALRLYGSAARTVPTLFSDTFTLLEPDQVQGVEDAVLLKHFDADGYPYGVTIVDIIISTSETCTDTIAIEEWTTDGSTWTDGSTVETITLSGVRTEDDGSLADPVIAADSYIYIDLDGTPTDIASMSVTFTYTVTSGN